MRASSKTGVQLTSLLDLLFIMIFISLLTTKLNTQVDRHVVEPPSHDNQTSKVVDSLKEIGRIRAVANGQVRKLFISNNYYKRGGRESYIETNLYAADDNQLWLYRINLDSAGLVDDAGEAPIDSDDSNRDGQSCTPVIVTRDKLVHDCRTVEISGKEIERHEITCFRISDDAYECKERLLQRDKGDYLWNYKMELVRIFDESLE